MRFFAHGNANPMDFTVTAPPLDLRDALQQRIDQKTKPLGALGRLEALAMQVALASQSLTPAIRAPQVRVFAADHGAAAAGISAYPQEVTAQMVGNFLAGGAAINVFCRQFGLPLRVVDAGVATELPEHPLLVRARVAAGTNNYLQAPAMRSEELAQALESGQRMAHALADEDGCTLLILGEMGIGNTASASLLTACYTGLPLAQVTGRGTGLDDAGLARKLGLLERALARGGVPQEPLHTLAEYGGLEIAMMTGAILGAAQRRMMVLVDGFIVTAAVLAAHALAPAVLPYCIFSHQSDEPGHQRQLEFLQARPLLHLGLRLGEGSGAALAYPLVCAAVGFLNEMASFHSAGVSEAV